MPVELRAARPEDEAFLWVMLLHAAHAGDEVASPDDLRSIPELARYVEGWGRPGDVGVVASAVGRPVGAAWVRRLVGEGKGYGWVDDATPELAIAVEPGREGEGIGSALLARLLADVEGTVPAVSLSVRADNPARRLYERYGFVDVAGSDVGNRVGGTSLTMVRRTQPGGRPV
jgi:ribosomal protein S18 acetylase RimI-like enzyme